MLLSVVKAAGFEEATRSSTRGMRHVGNLKFTPHLLWWRNWVCRTSEGVTASNHGGSALAYDSIVPVRIRY